MKSNFVKASMSTPTTTRVLETELDPGTHGKDEDDGGHGSELDDEQAERSEQLVHNAVLAVAVDRGIIAVPGREVVVEGGGVDDAIAKDQSERLLSTG